MRRDLNEDQLKLADLMSNISEDGYSAGWMEDLEFNLWDALNGGEKKYGRHIITSSQLEELKFLSQMCGCWIIFNGEQEETAIDIEEWRKIFIDARNGGRGYRH